MRDFRDAKSMAHALRNALKSRAIETTHSECLELIARAFGYENWNVLSANIDAAKPRASGERALLPAGTQDPAPRKTLYCSFCSKSQHEVKKLIAGPSVYICDRCVALSTEIVTESAPIWKVLGLLFGAGEGSRNDAYLAAVEYVRSNTTEDVTAYVETSSGFVERTRRTLNCIRRTLAMRDGEAPAADDVLASPEFAHMSHKTEEELLAMQRETKLALQRYEGALRIGRTVLEEREEGA